MAQLPPGSETLLGIFDLRGFGNRNADLGFVRFLVPAPSSATCSLLLFFQHPGHPSISVMRPVLYGYIELISSREAIMHGR